MAGFRDSLRAAHMMTNFDQRHDALESARLRRLAKEGRLIAVARRTQVPGLVGDLRQRGILSEESAGEFDLANPLPGSPAETIMQIPRPGSLRFGFILDERKRKVKDFVVMAGQHMHFETYEREGMDGETEKVHEHYSFRTIQIQFRQKSKNGRFSPVKMTQSAIRY